MTERLDAIVVGSGASGVHAAFPLVEAGLRVVMLDVGHEDLAYERLIPPAPFADIRRSDGNQHRYFLGDRLEGVSTGATDAGPQITPPRAYVLKDSQRLGPKRARNFEPLESFALGGLARAWGAVAFPFLDVELSRCGLPAAELLEHYEIIARRIGISGQSNDDLCPVRGRLAALQPPLRLDHNAAAILDRYAGVRKRSLQEGWYLGPSVLAALSEALGDRQPNSYGDMDFWSNHGRSVYRPNITLEQLRARPNFIYRPGFLVSGFSETGGEAVSVTGSMLEDNTQETLKARSLVLAAGSLGTTRLVLRSLGMYDRPVPFACNPHTYMPCLHYRGLALFHAERCHSLAQLTMIYDPTRNGEHLVQAQMYSYRSLHLFRLLKEAPLPHREGLRVMRELAPHFVIWVIQHEDVATSRKYCVLRRGRAPADETLEIEYGDSAEEHARRDQHEKRIAGFVRRLGCLPLKRVHAIHGSSVHYAGQFPMTREDRPLTTEPSGRLRGTRAVYLADGAAFAYLPAKGPTLTLMANANRIGVKLRERLHA
jgi:choline dehydrogenase-like flavoprotein